MHIYIHMYIYIYIDIDILWNTSQHKLPVCAFVSDTPGQYLRGDHSQFGMWTWWTCHEPGPELRIKNTFYEFCIPKDVEPLVRTKTAPSAVNKMGLDPGFRNIGSKLAWLVVCFFFYFFHILGIIIPIDFHIFQRGGSTTNQLSLYIPLYQHYSIMSCLVSVDEMQPVKPMSPHEYHIKSPFLMVKPC